MSAVALSLSSSGSHRFYQGRAIQLDDLFVALVETMVPEPDDPSMILSDGWDSSASE